MSHQGICICFTDTSFFPATSCHMYFNIPTLQSAADGVCTLSPEQEAKWLCSLMYFNVTGVVLFDSRVLAIGLKKKRDVEGLKLALPMLMRLLSLHETLCIQVFIVHKYDCLCLLHGFSKISSLFRS